MASRGSELRLSWSTRVGAGMGIPAIVLALVAIATASGGTTAEAGRQGTAAGSDFSKRCLECHTVDAVLSHPTDVRPTRAMPGHLPLDDGRMTCITCHQATSHSTSGKGSMLRPTIGAENFCAQCHTDSEERKAKAHVSLGKAHLQGATGKAGKQAGRRDDETRSCMGCHDGAMAGDAGGHTLGFSGSADQERDHPVGVAYRAGRSAEVRLVETPKLDRRIRLFDQSVGCGSCHSVYSTQKRLLVMSNLGSKLCLGCHVQ